MLTVSARRLPLASGVAVAALIVTAARADDAKPTPAPALEGAWVWDWKDREGQTHRHVMQVEGQGARLAARETFDDQPPVRVSKLALDGTSLTFTVVRDGRRSDYRGKVAGPDRINGTVLVTFEGQSSEYPWQAERKKPAASP